MRVVNRDLGSCLAETLGLGRQKMPVELRRRNCKIAEVRTRLRMMGE